MITENEVLEVLKNHSIRNSDSLVTDLGLKPTIDVKKYDPRAYQLPLITMIINKIVHEGKRTIVLNLPTGSGKSYIATALSILMDYYEVQKIGPTSKSIALTFRNNLFEQYIDSFKFMYSIKGKSNYKCLLDYSPINSKTLCVRKSSKDCNSRFMCEYYLQRSNFYKSKSLITNYNWFIFNYHALDISEFTGTLIMDEVHKMFDIIDEIFTPDLSKINELFQEVYKVVNPKIEYRATEMYFALDSSNYSMASKVAESLTEDVYTEHELSDYIGPFEDAKTTLGLLEIIQNFSVPNHLSRTDKVKFVVNKLAGLDKPNRVKIFMSATITEKFYYDNFHSGSKDDVFYYSMDPIFDQENRRIIAFSSLPSVNYERLQDKEFLDSWSKLIEVLIDHHKDEKGFVYVNSYQQVRYLKQRFYGHSRLIFNDNSSNAKSTLKAFVSDKTNRVLISPNLKEGYDFKGDISRFQIIAKIPFVHHSVIQEYGEEFYYNKTVIALLQIYGRSIRSIEDYATTYIIDGALKSIERYLPKWFLESIIMK